MSINVEFKYSLNGEDEWRKLPLTAEEFFDPLEPGEDLDYDCVPIHLDPRKYVAIDPTQIRAVVVGTNDNNGNSTIDC